MNLLFAINKGYVEQLNILLNSIQDSNPEEKFDVYILHKNISKTDMEYIKTGIDLENMKINFIKIPKAEVEQFPVYEKKYPVEIYFRLLASKYLPKELDRILYLDADTIVINSLRNLYEMDFEDNYYIATTHVQKLLHKINEIRLNLKQDEPYINTGVLLMNLKEIRKMNIEQEIIDFIEKNKKILILPDQDIISSMYGDKIKLVDGFRYNLGERDVSKYNLNNLGEKMTLKWIRQNTVIIHYYGRNKPWKENYIGRLGIFYEKAKKKRDNKIESEKEESYVG